MLGEKTEPIEMTAERHVFIIGSKGIPANYGGFETFVEKLTQNQMDRRILYHVARIWGSDNPGVAATPELMTSYPSISCALSRAA